MQELESFPGSEELGNRDRRMNADIAERVSENYAHMEMINGKKPLANKRKACDFTEAEAGYNSFLLKDAPINVSVRMKEKEVSVQMHCPWREYLLLDIVESMGNHNLDPLSVQSSTADGILTLTIKSKVFTHKKSKYIGSLMFSSLADLCFYLHCSLEAAPLHHQE